MVGLSFLLRLSVLCFNFYDSFPIFPFPYDHNPLGQQNPYGRHDQWDPYGLNGQYGPHGQYGLYGPHPDMVTKQCRSDGDCLPGYECKVKSLYSEE